METTTPERRFWITGLLDGQSVNVQVAITREDTEARMAIKAAGFRYNPSNQEWEQQFRTGRDAGYLASLYRGLFGHGFVLAVPYGTPGNAVRHLTLVGLDWRTVPIQWFGTARGEAKPCWHPVSTSLVEEQIADSRNWPQLGAALR